MLQKLSDIKLKSDDGRSLPWEYSLDMVTDEAVLVKNVEDDFTREATMYVPLYNYCFLFPFPSLHQLLIFYYFNIHLFTYFINNVRYQTTLANVKKAFSKMDELGIPYKRPDDYFAEMVKTDEHMLKIKVCH